MRKKSNIITRIIEWANDYEPVKARAFVLSLLALLAPLGYSELAEGLEPIALAGVGVVSSVVAFIVLIGARKHVYSKHTLEGDADAAASVSEEFDHTPVVDEVETVETEADVDEHHELDEGDDGLEAEPSPDDDQV